MSAEIEEQGAETALVEQEQDEMQYIIGPDTSRIMCLPVLVDDADLDPYEFRLLVHYYRTWTGESAQTTANRCHMGKSQVIEKRRSLMAKGWIVLEPVPGEETRVRLVDRWGG